MLSDTSIAASAAGHTWKEIADDRNIRADGRLTERRLPDAAEGEITPAILQRSIARPAPSWTVDYPDGVSTSPKGPSGANVECEPPAARKALPSEPLFTFVRASDQAPMSCELRFHGES